MSKDPRLIDELTTDQLVTVRAELRIIVAEWIAMRRRVSLAAQTCGELEFRLAPLLEHIQNNITTANALHEQVDLKIHERVRK